MASLVLTAVADDRAGLVDQLTRLLADQRANVADSRMIHLAGRFAIVMLIQIADDHADALKQIRNELEQLCAERNCDLDIDRT
ncbi:MAG: ACT domain-containing protein [Phycisphaeraceae bacterium]